MPLPLLPVTLSAGSAELNPGLDYIVQIGTYAVTVQLTPRMSGSATLTKFRAGLHSAFLISGEDYETVTLAQEAASDFVGTASASGTAQTSAALATTAITNNINKGGNALIPVTKGRYPPFWNIRPVTVAVLLTAASDASAGSITDTDTWTVPSGARWRIVAVACIITGGDNAATKQVEVYVNVQGDTQNPPVLANAQTALASTNVDAYAFPAFTKVDGASSSANVLGANGFVLVGGDKLLVLTQILTKTTSVSDTSKVAISIIVEEDG